MGRLMRDYPPPPLFLFLSPLPLPFRLSGRSVTAAPPLGRSGGDRDHRKGPSRPRSGSVDWDPTLDDDDTGLSVVVAAPIPRRGGEIQLTAEKDNHPRTRYGHYVQTPNFDVFLT